LRLNIITRILLFTVGFFYCPNCLHFIEAVIQYVIPEKFLINPSSGSVGISMQHKLSQYD